MAAYQLDLKEKEAAPSHNNFCPTVSVAFSTAVGSQNQLQVAAWLRKGAGR